MKMWSKFNVIFIIIQSLILVQADFEEILAYNQLSYENLPESKLSNSDYFIPLNNIPFGVAYYKGFLYVTCPRRRKGVPSTLNRIHVDSINGNKSPSLEGYPNYELNDIITAGKGRDEQIVSVYRPTVDSCGRLWFVDTGVLEYPTGRIVVQPPSIWVMDLNTGNLIRRFEISETMIPVGKGLTSITVDVDTCENTFAYVNDLFSFSLIVYSLASNTAWQFKHNFFYLDPLQGTFDVSNIKFMFSDGIFSITLGDKDKNGFKPAFFHSSCSLNEFTVSTQVLQNQTLSTRFYHNDDFKYYGTYALKHQANIHVIDPKTGVVFLNQFPQYGVGCFNLNRVCNGKLIKTRFVQRNKETMVYPCHLSIDENRDLWLLTNNVPKFFYVGLNETEINFRIWKISVDDAIRQGHCLR